MLIHTSLTSPFARKVRIFAEITQEPGITWVVTKPLQTPGLRLLNPLGKIPALESSEIALFDSSLICEYLDHLYSARSGKSLFHRAQADYFAIQKQHYLANGIMDAAVAAVMDVRRPDKKPSEFWLARWYDTISFGLGSVQVQHLGLAAEENIAGIAMACALGYLQLRLPQALTCLNDELKSWHQSISLTHWYQLTLPQDQ